MPKAQNGWLASKNPADFGGLTNITPKEWSKNALNVRRGAVAVVLTYVLVQFHKRVESISLYAQGDEWGYYFRLIRAGALISNHGAGCAIDLNAVRHPLGKWNTFTPAQRAEIRKIMKELDGVVRWGGDYKNRPDDMHFEVVGSIALVERVAKRLTNIPVKPSPKPSEPDYYHVDPRKVSTQLLGLSSKGKVVQRRKPGFFFKVAKFVDHTMPGGKRKRWAVTQFGTYYAAEFLKKGKK